MALKLPDSIKGIVNVEFFTPFTNSKITAPYALQKLTDQKLSFECSHYVDAY